MSFEFFIAKRYLISKRKSRFLSLITVISIGGVLVGVAALIIVLSVMNGFEREVRGRIIGTTAHLTVFSFEEGGVGGYEGLVDRIEKHNHVVAAAPFVYAKAAIASQEGADGIVVRGVVIDREVRVTNLQDNVVFGGMNLSDGSSPGILMGTSLADQLQVSLGDKVTLYGLGEEMVDGPWTMPKVATFRVVGLFETGMYEYDSALAYIPLSTAQRLFNLGQRVSGIQVRVDDIYRAGRMANSLGRELGYPYYAVDWMHMHKNLFSWMTLEKWGMFLVLLLIIMVAAFNIISTLIMVVLEKTKEIGILKSMGASSFSVMKIFVFEGMVVGTIGAILGCGIGYVACWTQETFRFFSLPPEIYFINSLPIDMRATDFIFIVLAALAICFLASLYPARRAARMAPVEAIRYE